MILAESKQMYIDNELINSFSVEQGQIVQISVPSHKIESTLIDGLTNKSKIEGLNVYDTFIFADYISNQTPNY